MMAAENMKSNADPSEASRVQWNVAGPSAEDHATRTRNIIEELCRTYRFPVYAYIHEQVGGVATAWRVTREFFAWFLAEANLARLARANGRFRCVLLAALREYLATKTLRTNRDEAASDADSEHYYDQVWALAVRYEAFARLRKEYALADKMRQFNELKVFLSNDPALWGSAPGASQVLEAPGAAIAVAVAADRFRFRYGELIQAELARIVGSRADLEAEMRYLFQAPER